MLRALLLVTLFASAGALGQNTPPLLQPNGVVPLALDQAPLLFQQCSRNSPSNAEGLWLPSSEQIAELERGLLSYIAERKGKALRIPPETATYGRQYIGFTRNGARFLYGSYFLASVTSDPRPKGVAVRICDGGPLFWGIVYSLKSKAFTELEFNGPS